MAFRAILTAFSNSFSARVEKGRPLLVVSGRDAIEGLGDGDVTFVAGDHEAGVREQLGLMRDCRSDVGIGVADRGHCDPGSQVDQRIAVDIDEDATSCSGNEDRDRHAHPGRHGTFLACE